MSHLKQHPLERYIKGKSKPQLRKIFTLPGADGHVLFQYFLESRNYSILSFEDALRRLTLELDLTLNLVGEEITNLLLDYYSASQSQHPMSRLLSRMDLLKLRFNLSEDMQ